MSADGVVPRLLDAYGGRARRLMATYLQGREPRRWLYDVVADYPSRGGRAMRPTLCIATARMLGRPLEDALHAAVTIELMHNAMLIHDDIEDESELRRGKPTLHVQEGLPIALNAGDMLALTSLRPLVDGRRQLGDELTFRLLEETERMARESAEGQALELGWRRDNPADVTEEDYLRMVGKKTCWLATIYPLRVGALIATRSDEWADALLRIGFLLGAAFQIQDDLLNLEGDADDYGKELAGDIYEGKRTLMLIHLLEQAEPDERDRVLDLLARPRPERDRDEVRWVRHAMDRYDCLAYARRVAHALAGAAEAELERVLAGVPPSDDRAFLEALPRWVITRA